MSEVNEGDKKNTFATIGMIIAIGTVIIYSGFALLNIAQSVSFLSFLGVCSCCLWPFAGIGCLGWFAAIILAIIGLVKASELGGKGTAIIALVLAGLVIIIMMVGLTASLIIGFLGI